MESAGEVCGYFCENPWLWGSVSAIGLLIIGYLGLPLIVWTVAIAGILVGFGAPTWALILFAVIAIVLDRKSTRLNSSH